MSSELGVERPTTLALANPPPERRVHFTEAADRSQPLATPSPRKPRPDPDFRPKRKRSLSFSGAGGDYRGNKRRKRGRVLPSKFLLGGSITDPLNLGSLDDEEEAPPADCGDSGGGGGCSSGGGSNSNKKWAAVRVIIPPNINDPLNLDASSDNEDLLTDALSKSLRRRRRSRKRKRRLSEPTDSTTGAEMSQVVQEADISGQRAAPVPLVRQNSLKPLTVNTELTASQGGTRGGAKESGGPVTPTGSKPPGGGGSGGMPRVGVFKKQRSKSDNKIVSPVIPQPGGERKRHPSHSRHHADKPHLSQQNLRPPATFNPKNEVFQYGNYNKYYGYRNPTATPDPRLQYLRREWCEGREVLDVGCNIGHIALTIARDYSPKRVVGIDIDKKLISIAGKNIKHYLRTGDPEEAAFPSSMRLLYGPLNTPVRADGTRAFPYNIKFIHANYVLESDELLETVRPEFDLILCLSITKWIHLNWGDSGLKRFFRRCFLNLRPGGRLLLEPQAWPSYNKRRKLTKRIFDNYKSIRLFPDKFNDFLLHEVGFSTSEKLGTPHHTARGFQRPIIVYTKAGGSSKCSPAGESGVREVSSSSGSSSSCSQKKQEEAVKNDQNDIITQSVSTASHSTLIPTPSPSSHSHITVGEQALRQQTADDQIARENTAGGGGGQISRQNNADQISRQDTLIIQDRGKMSDNNFKENIQNLYQFNQETLVQDVRSEKCKNSDSSDSKNNVCDNTVTVGESKYTLKHSPDTNTQKESPTSTHDDQVSKDSSTVRSERCIRQCPDCDKGTSPVLPDQQDNRTGRVSSNCKCSDVTGTKQTPSCGRGGIDGKIEIKHLESDEPNCLTVAEVSAQPLGSIDRVTNSEVNPESEENTDPKSKINFESKEGASPKSEINPVFSKPSVEENVQDSKTSTENVDNGKLFSAEEVDGSEMLSTEKVEDNKTIHSEIVSDSNTVNTENAEDSKASSAQNLEDSTASNTENSVIKSEMNRVDSKASGSECVVNSTTTNAEDLQESTTNSPRKRRLSTSDMEDGKSQNDDSSKKPRLEDT